MDHERPRPCLITNATRIGPAPPLVLRRCWQCDTMGHMKTITIRELHQATGHWVRRARAGEVYVTERGRLVAKIVPASPLPAKPFFANPKFTQAFLAQRKYLRGGTDSTVTITEDRAHDVS